MPGIDLRRPTRRDGSRRLTRRVADPAGVDALHRLRSTSQPVVDVVSHCVAPPGCQAKPVLRPDGAFLADGHTSAAARHKR